MKRTIEIDDTLDERVEDAKSELRDVITEYVESLPEEERKKDIEDIIENWYQGHEQGWRDSKVYGCDLMSEIADSNTPIHYSEIDALHYLHGNALDEAYDNAGIGDKSEHSWKQVALYCYISQALHEIYEETFKNNL